MNKNIKFADKFVSGMVIAVATLFVVATPAFVFADTFNRELSFGMSGSDVSVLQTYLAHDASIYPQGLVTGYFGKRVNRRKLSR